MKSLIRSSAVALLICAIPALVLPILAGLLPARWMGLDTHWLLFMGLPVMAFGAWIRSGSLVDSESREPERPLTLGTLGFLYFASGILFILNFKIGHSGSGLQLLVQLSLLITIWATFRLPRGQQLGHLVFATLVTASALLLFRSFAFFEEYLEKYPLVFALAWLSSTGLLYLLWNGDPRQGPSSIWRRFHNSKLGALSVLIFSGLLLSFRTDTASNPTAFHHWEYYIGPVRSWISGMEILGNIPSQYGLLNVFGSGWIGSVVSHWSGAMDLWRNFYLYQSLLLLLSFGLFSAVILKCQRGRLGISLALSLPICFFFADPMLIGPQPFPSSSALRFFPFYLNWLVLLWLMDKALPKTLQETLPKEEEFEKTASLAPPAKPWLAPLVLAAVSVLGFFWSFEAFAYVIVPNLAFWIFLGLEAFRGQKKFPPSEYVRLARVFVFGLLVFGLFGLLLVYGLLGTSSHLPMLWESAFGYAGGFGKLAVDPLRTTFFLLFGLFVLVAAMARAQNLRSRLTLIVCASSWWILSSYYLGRAAPDNVLAMLPQYLMLSWIGLAALPAGAFKVFLRVQISVLMFVPMMATFAGLFFFKIHNAKNGISTFQVSWDEFSSVEILQKADADAQKLIDDARVSPSEPLIVYSQLVAPLSFNSSSFGRWVPQNTWIPNPMQLMEEPMPRERRRELLASVAKARVHQYGYMLVSKSIDYPDRWPAWLEDLSAHWDVHSLGERGNWILLKFIAR